MLIHGFAQRGALGISFSEKIPCLVDTLIGLRQPRNNDIRAYRVIISQGGGELPIFGAEPRQIGKVSELVKMGYRRIVPRRDSFDIP